MACSFYWYAKQNIFKWSSLVIIPRCFCYYFSCIKIIVSISHFSSIFELGLPIFVEFLKPKFPYFGVKIVEFFRPTPRHFPLGSSLWRECLITIIEIWHPLYKSNHNSLRPKKATLLELYTNQRYFFLLFDWNFARYEL